MAEEGPGEPEKRTVVCSDGLRRVCKARRNGWTAKRRGIFLEHLAATSNVTASAREVGIHVRSAFYLRARDAQFAQDWDEALRTSQARLAGKLIVYAETRGKTPPRDGEEADELAGFDPQLALQMLAVHRDRLAGRRRGGGPRPRIAGREEVEAAALKLLKKIAKRLGEPA